MIWGGEHIIQHTDDIELYTLNLYNFIYQCDPNKFNSKKKTNWNFKNHNHSGVFMGGTRAYGSLQCNHKST